jgi:hypothetical protein
MLGRIQIQADDVLQFLGVNARPLCDNARNKPTS